jgi:hypothetical protein
VKTAAMTCVLRRAETLVRLLREAVEVREACPFAATADQLEQGKAEPDQGGGEYDRWFAKQAGARADAFALSEIRHQFRKLTDSFAAADCGADGLSISARVMLARRLREGVGERRGQPKKNKKNSGFPPGFPAGIPRGRETRDALARAVGLGSSRRLRLAGSVVDGGDAGLIAAMDAGELSIEEAARRVRARAGATAPLG